MGWGGGGYIRNFAVMQYVGLLGRVVFVFYNFAIAFAFQICTLMYCYEEAIYRVALNLIMKAKLRT